MPRATRHDTGAQAAPGATAVDPAEGGRAATATALGLAVLWSGDLPQASRLLDEGFARATSAGLASLRLEAAAHAAVAAAWRGRLRRTDEYAAIALSLAADEGRPGGTAWRPAAVPALVALSWVAAERAEPDLARRWAELARRVDGADGASRALAVIAEMRARVVGGASGRVRRASSVLAADRGAGPLPVVAAYRRALVGAALLADGAADAVARVLLDPGDDEITTAELVVHAARLLVSGDPRGARELAGRVRRPHAAEAHLPELVESWVLDAIGAAALGHADEAGGSLATALSLARREGLRLPFVHWAGHLVPLLREGLPLADREDVGAALWAVQQPYGRLTAREQTVLRSIAGPSSAAQIAAELSLSVNTLKAHLRSVYRKLGVTRRPDAVRRARELHLI